MALVASRHECNIGKGMAGRHWADWFRLACPPGARWIDGGLYCDTALRNARALDARPGPPGADVPGTPTTRSRLAAHIPRPRGLHWSANRRDGVACVSPEGNPSSRRPGGGRLRERQGSGTASCVSCRCCRRGYRLTPPHGRWEQHPAVTSAKVTPPRACKHGRGGG